MGSIYKILFLITLVAFGCYAFMTLLSILLNPHARKELKGRMHVISTGYTTNSRSRGYTTSSRSRSYSSNSNYGSYSSTKVNRNYGSSYSQSSGYDPVKDMFDYPSNDGPLYSPYENQLYDNCRGGWDD